MASPWVVTDRALLILVLIVWLVQAIAIIFGFGQLHAEIVDLEGAQCPREGVIASQRR